VSNYNLLSIIRRKKQYISPRLVSKTYNKILSQDFITTSIDKKWVTGINSNIYIRRKLFIQVIKYL